MYFLCQCHQASNSTCNLSMERPELVENHLLLSIIHQRVYCYLFPDCSHTFPWDGICFLKVGFGDWLSSMNSGRYHVTMVLLPNCQTHKVLSKWPYQPTFPSPPLPCRPRAPILLKLQTSVVTHGSFSFSSIFVNKYLLVPLFTESALKRHLS